MRRFDAWRVWRLATGKQRALAVVAVVVLLSGALAPLAYQVYAARTQQAGHAKSSAQMPDPRAAAQRFQQQHFGKQNPTVDAYTQARVQAARLPRARLGAAAGTTQQHAASSGANGNTTPATVPGVWQPVGPQAVMGNKYWQQGVVLGGDTTGIAVNAADANDVWIGSSVGGVWHTTDGGTSWTPMTDHQPTLAIGSIAIDPTNPNIVYAGTGDANKIYGNDQPGLGVLKTTDGGQTWTLLDQADFSRLAIGKIAIDPANPQVLLLAAGWDGSFLGNPDKTGIWRSTDGGVTWTQTLSDPGKTHPDAGTDVVFDPANPNIAFAGLGNLYALSATTASGVYTSTDNGQHWAQITGLPTGSDVERVTLTISPNGTNLYALLVDGDYRDLATGSPSFGHILNGFYRTTDGAATWTNIGKYQVQSSGIYRHSLSSIVGYLTNARCCATPWA